MACAFSVAPAYAQGNDPVTRYLNRLAAVENGLSTGFSLAPAQGRLTRLFNQEGIGFSRRYVDRWGENLTERWQDYAQFLDAHRSALEEWRAGLGTGQIDVETARAVLDEPVEQLLDIAWRIAGWMAADAETLAERAFWTDLAQETGCCEALYYHALAEAEMVWVGSDSPDPAGLASLQLIPPLDAEAREGFSAPRAAFTALADRAAELRYAGEGTPAERRALINEAMLLIEVFDLGATLPAGFDFAWLEQREDHASRAVAPLISLAALTQSQARRARLLAQAQSRLSERAELLRPLVEAEIAANGVPLQMAEAPEADQTDLTASAPAMLPQATRAPADTVGEGVNWRQSSPNATTQASNFLGVAGLIGPGGIAGSPIPAARPASPEMEADIQAALALDEALAELEMVDQNDPAALASVARLAAEADRALVRGQPLQRLQDLAASFY